MYCAHPRAQPAPVKSAYRQNLESFRKIVGTVDIKQYPILVDEAFFREIKHKLENAANRQQFSRVLEGTHKDLYTFQGILTDSDDVDLLNLQVAHLINVFDQTAI